MDNNSKVNVVITTAAASAVGAALIPIPVGDTIMISGIQIGMLVSISTIYGKIISKDTLKGLLLTFGTASMGIAAASALKAIPGIGTVLGIVISASIAGTLTVTLGIAFSALCKSGKPITPENLKSEAINSKAEATKMAEEFKRKAKRTEELKSSIAFKAVPAENFTNRVEFYFNNTMDIGSKTIRVTELNGGTVIWQSPVIESTHPVIWEPKNVSGGTYIAYLDIADLIPIPIKLTR